MKIALIGCGFFAMNQLHGWQGIESATVVALCDRDPERLKVAQRPSTGRAHLHRRRRDV